MGRAGQARKEKGFTLAELMVATMLMSIVMTAVYTLFHSAIGSWRAVEQDFDPYQDARNAVTVLQREVHNLIWQAGHLFEGENDEFTMFIATEPMNVEESEGRHLMRVRYYYNQGQKELMREEAFVQTALPKVPRAGRDLDRQRIKLKHKEKFVVAENVIDFRVRYIWMPIEIGRNPNLPPVPVEPLVVERHRERWGLPQALEITVVLRDPRDRKGKKAGHTVTSTIPIRTQNASRTRKGLDLLMGNVR